MRERIGLKRRERCDIVLVVFPMNMPTPNPRFGQLAADDVIERAMHALEENGITAFLVENGQAAFEKAKELIPEGSEVMAMTSVTLDTIGLAAYLNASGAYDTIRAKLAKLDRNTQSREMRKIAAAPDYVIGSVHAVTEDGHVFVASNTGSQLATYVYTAGKVIWVVGTQKIVSNDAEAMQRLHEYTYPLEDERAQKAYGMRSGVNKVLIVNKEKQPGRITLILVKEKLGF